jgi:type II secretory pathway pseudopilin PulG
MGISQHTQKSSLGFTIVEVLIATSVAGLIMLIVFQMIPVLQRNSRNSQRKNDIAVILQAVSRFELSSSGDLPTSVATTNFHLNTNSLTSYTPADISFNIASSYVAAAGSPPTNTSTNTVIINNRQLCNTVTPGTATGNGATFRSVVALFALETGKAGVTRPQCQEL